MLRRSFLSLVVPLVLACGAVAQSFDHSFGQPDETGAFGVKFDDRGAAVWSIDLLDHYSTPKREEFFELARPVEPGYASLILEPDGGAGDYDFGRPIGHEEPGDYPEWDREVLEGGEVVRYRLGNDAGMTLEKVFRHRPGRRELEVEIALIAGDDAGADSSTFAFSLLGPMLGKEDVTIATAFFGNPNKAIVQFTGPGGEPLEPVVMTPSGDLRNWLPVPVPEGGGSRPSLSFAGTSNRFFAGFAYPADAATAEVLHRVDVRAVPFQQETEEGPEPFTVPRMRYHLQMPVPEAGGESRVRLALYLGPKSYRTFDDVPEHTRFEAIMDSDLRPICFCTPPGVVFLGSVLLKLLGSFESLVGSYGVAIMMLTLLVRGALVPLNFRMQKSLRAYGAKMAVLKPKLDELKERYKDDPKGYQQAMVQFQREHKMIPPIGGCLPLLLTMPVFIGLFTALRVAYDLRHEGFLLWIDDLSQPDALFLTGIGFLPAFNLLPLIMVVLWWYLMSRAPLPQDPQQRQMQKMMRFMPFIFGVVLYNYAAGLMVYMITSSLFALVEQRITKRLLGPPPEVGGVPSMPSF